MIKSFLIFLSFTASLFASQQLILVVANDFNSSDAKLEFYEDSRLLHEANVTLGAKGLAWGIYENRLKQNANDPQKKEGDKRAPAGIFKLSTAFGYGHKPLANLPYLYSSKELICVDDVTSKFYNQLMMKKDEIKSFEWMRREDGQYRLGVVVEHNSLGVRGGGSCIFLHIQKEKGAPTAGCTAMQEEDIKRIMKLLDRRKNPLLIQIPKSAAKEVLKRFEALKNSPLLHPQCLSR